MEQKEKTLIKKYHESLYLLHKKMLEKGFGIMYEGQITHKITKAFTSLLEKSMENKMEDPAVIKKVFHVMVEGLQNISKHAYDKEFLDNNSIGNGIFIVGQVENEYHVITGNKISIEKVNYIKSLFDKLNSLSKEELTDLYKMTMKEGRISEKGGAGLGFIDIARKTGNKLECSFETIDDKVSFFILKIVISRTSPK